MSGAARDRGRDAAEAALAAGDERAVRMALSWVFDAGDPRVTDALRDEPPSRVWADTLAGRHGPGAQRRADVYQPDGLAVLARRSATRFVMPGDDEWPEQLTGLADGEPIQDRGGCPVGLWVRGQGNLAEWTHRAVGVVGARACSPYGQECATDLAAGVTEEGWTVVSGGAYGIDIAAHRGALAVAEGRTIAVMACGPDIEYPRGNLLVLQRLADQHLVVSEVPPGVRPTRVRFLSRNRVIAALGAGTVMVEAAARSGARNTMAWTEALGRVAMAVPGSVHSALSVGPLQLIKDRRAELVTGPGQVLELLSPIGSNMTLDPRGPQTRLDSLAREVAAVYEALPARGYRTAGEVSLATGQSVRDCLAALGALELEGLAEPVDGGWRAHVRVG